MSQAEPDLDLDLCAREPIHTPGSIQPHGALIVADAAGQVLRAAVPGHYPLFDGDPIGSGIPQLLPDAAEICARFATIPTGGTMSLGLVTGVGDSQHHCIAHRSGEHVILEFEKVEAGEPLSFGDLHPQVRALLDSVQSMETIGALADLAAREVRSLTGYDRVLVYRFDPEWNGTVLAEDRNDRLPSYLDLRFPASDIPAQARALYVRNRLRLIADASYEPVPIVGGVAGEEPVDLSHAMLRSVSPVHVEYMHNMGTPSSMSISLLQGDRLWGLISCHHAEARRPPYPVRIACDLLGQVLSLQITAREASAFAERRSALEQVQRRLFAHMAGAEHFVDGMVANADDLMALTGAHGAAVVANDQCVLLGETPDEHFVRALVRWLGEQERRDLFATDSLAADWVDGAALKARASGVIAISISQLYDSYVLWFRPEVIRTVRWGGDPHKPMEQRDGVNRLNPRTSFEAWQEVVRQRAEPWHPAEVEAAGHLRSAIVDIVLRNAEELAALTQRLTAINSELEAFSYSVSHDLRAPFRHIVGYSQLLKKYEGDSLSEKGNRYIDTIVESALSAGTLVDDLLGYSQMGRSALSPIQIDMNALVAEVRHGLTPAEGADIDWRVGELPPVWADPMMIRLVLQNLIDNAIKFSRDREPPIIEIGVEQGDGDPVYFVRDNGVGFEMDYVGKLFGVFQRLHRVEEFEGTGIGLANVKRIIERHGGKVWAEGRPNEGATFYITLPQRGS